MANTMGAKSFVCCYATLNEDKEKYAGFRNGILQGTPLGTFLGKQSQAFLTDMGFDYLWLSNGFGFGMETWNTTGAIFDDKNFNPEKMLDIQQKILDFLTLFRRKCPEFRIETRGTNLITGIDLASDGVDLRTIYSGGFNILPPPNSPWAALNGDYGLELAGYMSRMAELPDERYLFRFYTHDPWWANSPWLDRYGREPHDIYLPMAVSRVNSKGEVRHPTHLNFLSIDDSYGNMPDQVPNEVIPHILQGRRLAPDQPGQVVWVYPFDEYHDWAFNQPERIGEIFYGDWFIRQALNNGFPLNTVISTANFTSLMQQGNRMFYGSVLTTIVPEAGSEMEKQLMTFVRNGGNVLIYGPATHGSKEFLDFMNIRTDEALEGVIIREFASESTQSKIIYVRGTSYYNNVHSPEKWVVDASLMREALNHLGYAFRINKLSPTVRNPVNVVSRHDNGFYFAGFVPNQTIEQQFRFPQGAPIFTGMETELKDGYATYHLSKSWNKECLVYVEQNEGILICSEVAPVEYLFKRKNAVSGLKNATIRFDSGKDETHFKAMNGNNHYPARPDTLVSVHGNGYPDIYYEYKDVSGQIVFTW